MPQSVMSHAIRTCLIFTALKVKVNFTLQQATKAQKGSTVIALLFI